MLLELGGTQDHIVQWPPFTDAESKDRAGNST